MKTTSPPVSQRDVAAHERAARLAPSHYGRVRKPSRRSLHGPLSTRVANSPASGDLGVPARPSHDLPGAGAYVVSVAGVDLLESNADDKLALALAGGDPVHDLDALPLTHHDALA